MTHSPPEPPAGSLVRDDNGDIWQRVNAATDRWVQLQPLEDWTALHWYKLAPHVGAVLVPLPGLVEP